MLLLSLALTVLLATLFPVTLLLYDTLGIIVGSDLPRGIQGYIGWAIDYGPASLFSWWALRRLNVEPFAQQLVSGRRLIRIGLVLFGVYLFLALGGFVISAIPYGGGTVPRILGLLLAAVKGFLFAGIAIALCEELPAARARAPISAIGRPTHAVGT